MKEQQNPKVSYLKTSTFLVIVIDGLNPINLKVGSQKYKKAMKYIKRGDNKSLIKYLNKSDKIKKYVKDDIAIDKKGRATKTTARCGTGSKRRP